MYAKLFKNWSTVSAGLMISRLSGMLKVAVVAALFGTGDNMDAFLVAMAVPAVIVTIFGEAVYVATVKLVSRHNGERGGQPGGWREISALFNFSVLAMIAFAAFYWLCSPAIVRLVAPGFSEQQFAQARALARCVAPVIILGTVQSVLSGILHANGHFAVPALKLLVSNVFVVLSVVALSGELGIASYAVGSVTGELAVCLACYATAKRIGARYLFSWTGRSRGIRESINLGVPIMASVGTLQVTHITDRAFASGLDAGSISALGYAMLLLATPLSLVRTVTDVGFPSIAGIIHRPSAQRDRQLTQAVKACVTMLGVIAAPAAIMLLLWRRPVISLLLERGKFGMASADATATALLFYSFALVPLVIRYFLTRLSQSFGDSLTPLPSNITCTASNIALNALLVPMLGHAAIALSLALSTTLGVGILYIQLRNKIPLFRNCGMQAVALKVISAGAVMVAAYLITQRISHSVVGAGCAAMAVYPVALVIAGVIDVRHVLRRRASLQAPSA